MEEREGRNDIFKLQSQNLSKTKQTKGKERKGGGGTERGREEGRQAGRQLLLEPDYTIYVFTT